MKLGTAAVLALLLTSAASAAERGDAAAAKPPGAKAAAPAKGGAADARKPAASKGGKAKAQATSSVSPQARAVARQTKSVYIYAAESCARDRDRCDQALLEDAESRFLDSCGACNSAVRCEAERDAVKAGTARASQDPCAP